MIKHVLAAGFAFAALSGSASAAVRAPVPTALTCNAPVRYGDSAASLSRRFGKAARIMTLPGPEGEPFRAVVLWRNDPARRLEVTFWDKKMTRLAGVALGDSASRWSVGGLRLGDSLEQAEAVNGRAFRLGGFEWDYGGYLQDAKGGRLTSLAGGCRISVRLGLSGKGTLDNAVLGDVTLQSSDQAVRAALPVITDLSIGWAAPE